MNTPPTPEAIPLLPALLAQHTVESLYAEHGPARPWIYWLALLGVTAALAALPLIEVDVTVRSPGVVRPATERTELRVPLLFNLRRDPFEKAQHNASVYNDWFLDHAFVAVPLQQIAGRFLMSMKEYPPSQTPGSFNLDKIQKQIEAAAAGR